MHPTYHFAARRCATEAEVVRRTPANYTGGLYARSIDHVSGPCGGRADELREAGLTRRADGPLDPINVRSIWHTADALGWNSEYGHDPSVIVVSSGHVSFGAPVGPSLVLTL